MTDPTATDTAQERAEELLSTIHRIIGTHGIDGTGWGHELAQAFDRLDVWLSHGGTLPQDWTHPGEPFRHYTEHVTRQPPMTGERMGD